MRYYSPDVKQRVKLRPRTLGRRLAMAAVKKEVSVLQLAYLLGASRGTIYNWYAGKDVTNAYKSRVSSLINILTAAPTPEAAWSQACLHFTLPTSPPAN